MSGVWSVLTLIGLDLVLLIGWLAIPLGLSGNFIILGAALLAALFTKFTAIGWIPLIVMAAAVIAGEVIEAFLGSVVAQRFGASRWGMIGSFVGGIFGAVIGTAIFPVVGSLIGSFLGAAAGAMGFEIAHRREPEPGVRAGWGAFVGKVMATGIKTAIGTGMIVYIIIRTH